MSATAVTPLTAEPPFGRPRIYSASSAPTADNGAAAGHNIGDIVYAEGIAFTCVDNTVGAAVWIAQAGVDAGDVVPFNRGNYNAWPQNKKLVAFTVPAITAASRQVVQVTLGALKNPRSTVIAFFTSSAVVANLDEASGLSASDNRVILMGNNGGMLMTNLVRLHPSPRVSCWMLRVTEDYRQAQRSAPTGGNGFEKYGSGAGSAVDSQSFTYSDFAKASNNMLVGWYASGTPVGTLGLDKKVHLESAWLSTASGVTTLSLAFFNNDASANTAANFQVGVYE